MRLEERRRHARFPFERHLEVRGPGDLKARTVLARDISASGFSFFSESRWDVGDPLTLSLHDVDELTVRAAVRNVRADARGFVVGAERLSA